MEVNNMSIQPIAPRPPQRPAEKISANRRALAILLRQSDNEGSSVADVSTDGSSGRAPRRVFRTAGLLKEMTKIKTLDELVEHESQYRGIIESNHTRQFSMMTTQKYTDVTLIEEQGIVLDAERSGRNFVAHSEEIVRCKELAILQVIAEEFLDRVRFERSHPPQVFLDAYVDIQLRFLRLGERAIRSDWIEPAYDVETRETFGRYLLEQEYWQEWTGGLRESTGKKMATEHAFLEAQREERALCEINEYVNRDGLESVMHSQVVLLIGQARRDLRYLEHNDVQKREERVRGVLVQGEESAFQDLAIEALKVRRAVMGTIAASRLGLSEMQARNNIEAEAAEAFRLLTTQCLRSWHNVHEIITKRRGIFSSIVDSEQLMRVDVEDTFRASFQALLSKALDHHGYIAHRDWERRHVKDAYLDGRVAIWKQQEAVVDEWYTHHQRHVRLLALTRRTAVIEEAEEARRHVIIVEQWKVYLLFYLWNAVQRFKVLAVSTAQTIEKEEQEVWLSLMKRFELETQIIQASPRYVLVDHEETQRDVIAEAELDGRLELYRNFKAGRRDITNVVLDIGTMLVCSSEETGRRRLECQSQCAMISIQCSALVSACAAEKVDTVAVREATERRILYARILDYVRSLFHDDIEHEEGAVRAEIEQNKLMGEELRNRVALLNEEEERSVVLKNLFDIKDIKLISLMREEMDLRTSILSSADVHFNALSTQIACSSLPSHQPMFFSRLQDRSIMRQIRLLDARSFADDVAKEMQLVRCANEPDRRRWIVLHEFKQRLVLNFAHHETVSRQLIIQQECREAHTTLETLHRLHRRDDAHHETIAAREVDNIERVSRNRTDLEERAQLLHLLEVQDEHYRIAEDHIKLRMLLDEGPLLREYFRIAEELVSNEEIQRDTMRCHSIAELATRRSLPDRGTANRSQPPLPLSNSPAADGAPPAPSGLDVMSPPAKMKAPTRPQLFEVALHSVQVSAMTRSLSEDPQAPFMVQVTQNEDQQTWTTILYDETQHVDIGSKTLKVFQPADAAQATWSVSTEDGATIGVRVLHGGQVILCGSRHVPLSECIETDSNGLLVLPLLASMHGGKATGKVTMLVQIQ